MARAFLPSAAIRLFTESSVALLGPCYYLQPEEVACSMTEIFPDGRAGYEGLIDIIRPCLEKNWDVYCTACD